MVCKEQVIYNAPSDRQWQKASPFYIVEDNRGVANQLSELFSSVNIPSKVVGKVPGNAAYVIYLKGLNEFTDQDHKELVALNKDAFVSVRTSSKVLFEKQGCFIIPFDNGLNSSSRQYRAWSGGLGALAKTARLEWKTANVQAINIDSGNLSNTRLAEIIFKTIISGSIQTETFIDHTGKQYIYAEKQTELKKKARSFNNGDVLVISGGAQGVTAECLIALSKRKKLKFGILGRTELSEGSSGLDELVTETEIKKALVDEALRLGKKPVPVEINNKIRRIIAIRNINKTLETLKKQGSEVLYLSSDVSDRKAVIGAVNKIRQQFGRISGIVHAAGIVADKYIHEKTDEQFDKVFGTKVTGFDNLLGATKNDLLTHICCFSSVAARRGNPGQADYAMSNEVLNKVCQKEQFERGKNCVVKSINWGPWEGGMVTDELKSYFKARGVELIPLEKGVEMFADEMEDASVDNVEVVVRGKWE